MTALPPISTIALSVLSEDDLLKIQEMLLAAGFSPGKPDGLIGPLTLDAWADFKESVNLHSFNDLQNIGKSSYDLLVKASTKRKGRIHDFSTKQGTIDAIRWECSSFGLNLKTQQAYVLATVQHETANTFKPVEEYGRGRGRSYGKPDPITGQIYYGRGFVQLTWKNNYAKYARILGIDLVNNPNLACNPNVALFILCHGFRNGIFTGKRLTDYVAIGKTDFLGARRCINGTDQANQIAALARKFL